MAALRKRRSGLPVNLYLDDAGSRGKSGHWKRIKFQPDRGDSANTRNTVPMSISDDPQILIRNPRLSLSAKDIEKVKNFVKMNRNLLLQIANEKIDFGEFLDRMKT
jgi:hypothetical protein